MVGSIGCYVAGCENPVIGQCMGYQGNCGQFHCREHSTGKLCTDCAGKESLDRQRKVLEEEIERVRIEYAIAKKNFKKKPGVLSYLFAILPLVLVVTSVIPLVSGHTVNVGPAIVSAFPLYTVAIAGILHFLWKSKRASNLAETEKTKPGFRTYYEGLCAMERKAKSNVSENDAEKAAALTELLNIMTPVARQAGRNLQARGEWVGYLASDQNARESLVTSVVQDIVRGVATEFEEEDAQERSGTTGRQMGLGRRVVLGVAEGLVAGTGEMVRRAVKDTATPAQSGEEIAIRDLKEEVRKLRYDR